MQVNERAGGVALVVAGAGIVLGMAHHPTHLGPGLMNQLIHGVLLGFLGLTTFGFATLAAARGPRPTILAGAVCYAFALFGHVGAATIDGFVVPALAARGAVVGRDLFLLSWDMNQALATLGVVAAGLAILFWSADFLTRRGPEPRLIGALGVLSGAGPVGLLAAGAINMRVSGALIAYACHAAWGAAVGIHLLRSKAVSLA